MNPHSILIPAAVLSLALTAMAAVQTEDILVADFEQADYGQWKAEGEAFGPGPARGTLPGQMPVTGYAGEGLVNTFHQGDDSTGRLTSPPFKIERAFINFLMGGGGYPGDTCMNLRVNGEVVRTATGSNTRPGGSEELELQSWDVRDLAGRMATLEIVDLRTGGWGHVNVDQIVQSDHRPRIVPVLGRQSKELVLERRYLLFPIRTGGRMVPIDLEIGGESTREFDVELARTGEEVGFWSFLDITTFRGRVATLTVENASEEGFAMIVQSDEIPGAEKFYAESLRPQFHFSQMVGWNNDPNGLVHCDGEWHLFFQHNPYGWNWGNMHWGHAVSRDLVHWEQLPIALYNRQRGDWAFSGSAVVDANDTAGWQTGTQKVMVVAWTSTGRGECIAYSNDRGRTFTEYEGNPVVEHDGRDPKIIWYEPGQHWVMVVYDHHADTHCLAFYKSTNLRQWEFQSRLEGYYECPEIFELPVESSSSTSGAGRAGNTRWVVFAGDAQYALGDFDGKSFTPEHEGKHRLHYGEYYASQVFNNPPDARRIQIGWARIPMPGMPFNQTFTFPHQLTLRPTDDGVRLFAEPVSEVEKLHARRHATRDRPLAADQPVEMAVSGELFDIRAIFELGEANAVGLDLGGERIVYDARTLTLREVPLKPVDGKITIQVLVDRPMLEIVGNDGRVYLTLPRQMHGEFSRVKAFAEGGPARLVWLEVNELKSIWGE